MSIVHLHKRIKRFIRSRTRPYKTRFWGQEYIVKPELVSGRIGDGLQFIGVKPIDTRPNWYLVRIDSATNVYSEDFELESILELIEEDFGNAWYFEENENGKYIYRDDDTYVIDNVDWPMLHWSGGSWWCEKNLNAK